MEKSVMEEKYSRVNNAKDIQMPPKISMSTEIGIGEAFKHRAGNHSPDTYSPDSPNKLRRAWTANMKTATPGKLNCLCSPTTHVGSFRCRMHRGPGRGMIRGGSVGSNLSELASKSRPLAELI
ncbi:unnamed protein product [Linum tenue]|uniref:Uncharacterized protein n=1 Tax=Linum tenue TaxID=586396 RepID=A0AAV0N3P1_9ROSI|nr:unnamed protein product [Linum tenue]